VLNAGVEVLIGTVRFVVRAAITYTSSPFCCPGSTLPCSFVYARCPPDFVVYFFFHRHLMFGCVFYAPGAGEHDHRRARPGRKGFLFCGGEVSCQRVTACSSRRGQGSWWGSSVGRVCINTCVSNDQQL
jgi:hypothetical protein